MARAPERVGAAPRRTPTAEQQAIRADVQMRPEDGRKIAAFAGTGKTTTLEMLANDRRDPGLYLAFNRSIKEEAAQRFPRHIKVTTAHGAAFGALRMHDQVDRLNMRLFGDGVSKLVRLPHCLIPEDALGQVVLDTVARFCNSAELDLNLEHVTLDPREPEANRLAALEGARALFARMSDRGDDRCPMTHDTYLKMWQLGDARLNGREWALFDEAQDASAVMREILIRQNIPITWVGDEHQSIYQWRGAVNAMRMMPGAEFPLTQSFRFGQNIAAAANGVLRCKPEDLRPVLPIVGNPARASQVGTLPGGLRHTFLSRTNAEWFQEALAFQGRIHVIGGIDETEKLLMSAYELWRNNARPNRCAPAIARFASWRQLCEHADQFEDRELTFARNMVEKQYKDRLPGAIRDLRRRHVQSEADADLILSTAHKAKGREWNYVRLGSGFSSPLDEEWGRMDPSEQEAELNLLYVALTRAIDGMEPNQAVLNCMAVARGEARPGDEAPNRRLPEIRVAPLERPAPAAQAENLAAPPAQQAAAPPAQALARLWSAEEDHQAAEMLGQGFCVEDIAAWIDRPLAAVAVRLAVLHGIDDGFAEEIRAALAVPTRPAPQPRLQPVEDQADDGAGPMDYMEHFVTAAEADEPAPAFARGM